MLAQPVFGCAALSRGPHHRVLWLERRLIRHLDGHEPAGARVKKRERHADLRGTQTAPNGRPWVCHTWYRGAVARITHECSFGHALTSL
jgi:hypothetical protein